MSTSEVTGTHTRATINAHRALRSSERKRFKSENAVDLVERNMIPKMIAFLNNP